MKSIFGGLQGSGLKGWQSTLKMLTNPRLCPTTLTSMHSLFDFRIFGSYILSYHNPNHHTDQQFLFCQLLRSRPLPVRLFTLAMSKGVGRGVGTHKRTPRLFQRGGVTTAQGAGTAAHTLQIKWQTHTSKQLLPAGHRPSECLFVIAFCLVTLHTRGSSCYWEARIFIKSTLYEKCVWWKDARDDVVNVTRSQVVCHNVWGVVELCICIEFCGTETGGVGF